MSSPAGGSEGAGTVSGGQEETVDTDDLFEKFAVYRRKEDYH